MERLSFLGYPVDNITKDDILSFCQQAILNNTHHYLAVQNANKMYLSEKFPQVKEAIRNASIILPENAINLGMRWLGKPLKQRNIGGVIIMEELLKFSENNSCSIYLLGAKEENLNKLVMEIEKKYPKVKINGYRNGYFNRTKEDLIVDEISKLKPNFLFVGMGSPKQEFFIYKNFKKLNTNICLGVGGSFNVLAGLEKPAPSWSKYGLEWLYRSFMDPSKFKRYFIINSFFIYRFLKYIILRK